MEAKCCAAAREVEMQAAVALELPVLLERLPSGAAREQVASWADSVLARHSSTAVGGVGGGH